MEKFRQKLLYTREEAAEMLSITTRYLYTLEKKGLIRAKRTEGRVLFSLRELERFANDGQAA